jgi:hypothetical protein
MKRTATPSHPLRIFMYQEFCLRCPHMFSFSSPVLQPRSGLDFLCNWICPATFPSIFPSLDFADVSTPSSHLIPGLPTLLVPSGLENVTFLRGCNSSVLNRRPSYLNLVPFTTFTTSSSSVPGIAHDYIVFAIPHYH